ncbi:energy-coupling factor transport system ATP-binding protein [Paramicrobacterium agarici]|uniref:Energy-coupling factor transport system ATP-binding protein n=1 Tax=Paramicrobacterium agarici TaxID=630514 RepID=A0A2A9DXG0_9MICO|nr:ATP-binding cassette domain-containing protein [Microbacterium agarici]PFG31487.1 energy-coupling factor transport system ATP-binding protein [Microbacterium agarici]
MAGAHVRLREWGWTHAGRDRLAVHNIDLTIEPGESVLLLGASGAGKSTLLHGLAGVLGGDEDGDQAGSIAVDGRHPADARGVVGLVLQDPDSQIVMARVGDDIAFACENLGIPRDEIWRRVRWALDAVGLDLALDHPTSQLSGGQVQRLVLAGILAMRPRLLLLDEPTANLDPDGVREVRDVVAHVARETGMTLVVVEHRVAVWQDVVTRTVVLEPGGGLLADGPTREVLSRQGARLAERGIWTPDHPPAVGAPPEREPGALLMRSEELAVGRVPFAQKRPVIAASDLTFDLNAGTTTAVVGVNGAGKSTLALTAAGLLPPAAGRLEAMPELRDGAATQPHRWRSRELLTRIGTVFQQPEHQFLTGRVRDELAVGPRALRLSDSEVRRRTDELLERLRLARVADANPFTLSGGEKRRLSVATVLASRPRMLVLDEPTFGQDATTWRELVLLLRGLVDEGACVVAVTHDGPLVDALADATIRLGSPEGVLR